MKAILVIDTPNSCKLCKLYVETEWWCRIADRCPDDDMGENGRATWCPLRPLPEPKDIGYPNDDYDVGFGDGWDACLKELKK